MGKWYIFNVYTFCKSLCVINEGSPYGLHGDPIYILYLYDHMWLVGLFSRIGKTSEVYRRNINGPKTLPCVTPDTALTSLLRQPSTKTCSDRFDRNCVNTDNTEPTMPTMQSLQRMPWWLTLSKAALKSICKILPSCSLSMHFALYGTHTKVHQRYPDLSGKQGWKHTTSFHKSSKTNRLKALKHLWQYLCYGNRSVIDSRGGW